MAMRTLKLELFEPRPLQGYFKNKPRVVDEVATPEPPGFGVETEEPLQAPALHPLRRLAHPPGVKIEGRADADENRRVQISTHSRHPQVLFRRAEPDPDDVGAS